MSTKYTARLSYSYTPFTCIWMLGLMMYIKTNTLSPSQYHFRMHDSDQKDDKENEKSPDPPIDSLSRKKPLLLHHQPDVTYTTTNLSFDSNSIQHAKFDYSYSFFSRSRVVIWGGTFVAHMGSGSESELPHDSSYMTCNPDN